MAAILDVILFLTLPSTVYHTAVALVLGKLYSVSLLVVQNGRMKIRGARNRADESTYGHHSVHVELQAPSAGGGGLQFAHFRSPTPPLSQSTADAQPTVVEVIRMPAVNDSEDVSHILLV